MGHHLFELLRNFIVAYGYWAVAVVLLLENTGVPVPGESVLLVASFLAASQARLSLGWLIVVAVIAATFGDNLGYWIGRRGGRPLLDRYARVFRLEPVVMARGEAMFRQYGALTVLFARFVFGLRVIAGPLSGVLQMPWSSFALYNVVGATLWTTVICTAGYLFGHHWQTLLVMIRRVDVAIAVLFVLVLAGLWWRRRGQSKLPCPDDSDK